MARPHPLDAGLADLGGEHRAELVATEPDRLVADVDAALLLPVPTFPGDGGKRTYFTTAGRIIFGLL